MTVRDLPITRAAFPHLVTPIDFLGRKAAEPGFESIGFCLDLIENYLRMEIEVLSRLHEGEPTPPPGAPFYFTFPDRTPRGSTPA